MAGGGVSQRGHLQLVAGRSIQRFLALGAGAAEWNGRGQAATGDLDQAEDVASLVDWDLTWFNHQQQWFNIEQIVIHHQQ